MEKPNCYLVIAGEAIAREESVGGHSEILCTTEFDSDGAPVWDDASIADWRGGGGQAGYAFLDIALDCIETNARLCGIDVVRVPREKPAAA